MWQSWCFTGWPRGCRWGDDMAAHRTPKPLPLEYADIITAALSVVPHLPRDCSALELAQALAVAEQRYAAPRITSWPTYGHTVFLLAALDALAQEQGYTGLSRYVQPRLLSEVAS